MTPRRPRVVPVALAVVAAAAAASARQAAPFRGGTNVVSIYATVTDEAGRLVDDLTEADFTVTDNGRRRPLTFFSSERAPFGAVVMLDRSGSMAEHFDVVRDAAVAFLGHLLPGDRVRVGSFGRQIRIGPPEFTDDAWILTRVLYHELQSGGPSPVWTAMDRSITALRPLEGRRVIILFSDGHDEPMAGQVVTRLSDVERRVLANEIMVYAIGFPTSTLQWSRPILPALPATPGRPRPQGAVLTSKPRPPNRKLKGLAETSGGAYFELDRRADIAATFGRIADELHHQYWLGIAPEKLDGRTHRLEVRVSRPGLTVRARRSYVAAPPGAR